MLSSLGLQRTSQQSYIAFLGLLASRTGKTSMIMFHMTCKGPKGLFERLQPDAEPGLFKNSV